MYLPIKKILSDFRIWLFVFFLIRLIHIQQPPIESAHNWRQCLTSMISRNYTEGEIDLFHPEIDYTGNKSGVLASEFPIFNASIAITAKIFGYAHWHGRLINLIISTLGVWCFFLILGAFFDSKTAFYGGMMLLLSVWLMFSRKIMPDTLSVSLTICALYSALRYLRENKILFLLIFCLTGTLGVLAKMPAILILSPLSIVIFSSEFPLSRKIILFIPSVVIITSMIAWYYIWVPQLINSYGNVLYFPKTLTEGIKELRTYSAEAFNKFTFAAFHSYIGFLISLSGLLLAIIKKQKPILYVFGVMFCIFGFYMIKTGVVFATHTYYIIPFVPIMALTGGYAIANIRKQWLANTIFVLFAIEAIANQQHDVVIKDQARIKLRYEELADSFIPKNSLILTNGGMNPQQLYFINRKGWSKENSFFSSLIMIDSLKQCGLEYILINTCEGSPQALPYSLIHEERCIQIYSLKE